MTVWVPIQADSDGYVDRECPSKSYMYQFKVHEIGWTDLLKNESVFCPLCRHEAKADSWWNTEQVEGAKKVALEKFIAEVHGALVRGAKAANRRRQNGFINVSVKVTGRPNGFFLMPLQAKALMEQKIKCEKCYARFAVIGSGFFCPCCGHNSAERTFDDAIEKIKSSIGMTNSQN